MIAELILKYLEERKIEVADVASATEIEADELSKALTGETDLDFAKYAMICDFLEVPVEAFIEEDAASK